MKARFFAAGWRALMVSVLFMAASTAVQGQSVTNADSARSVDAASRWTFGGWVAGATGQPLETRMGHVHDRDLFVTAIRAAHPLVTSPRIRLESTIDVFPLVVATANRDYTVLDVPAGCAGPQLCISEGSVLIPSRHTAYGAGLAPLGLQGILALSRQVGLGLGVEGGALYFNRRIPDPGETRFNFMADANIALRVSLGDTRPTITGGFRLNHISNGGTGHVNPGMDSRLLFIGVER